MPRIITALILVAVKGISDYTLPTQVMNVTNTLYAAATVPDWT